MQESSIITLLESFPNLISESTGGKLQTKKYSFALNYDDDTKLFHYRGKFFFIGIELEGVPSHITIQYGTLKLHDVNEGAFVLGDMAGMRVSIASYTLIINPSDIPEVRKEVNTLKIKNIPVSTLNTKKTNIIYA